jgi:GNAT superfamily N-acetyltransferase
MSSLSPVSPRHRHRLTPLFASHPLCGLRGIMRSVLEGHLGEAYADHAERPRVAELSFAGVHFYGGDAGHPLASAIVRRLPIDQVVAACTPPWRALLDATYGPRLLALPATDYDARSLDRAHLERLAVRVPAGYVVERMNLDLARRVEAELGTEDHVHFFGSPEYFCERGIGFCILHEGRIVSAASSGAFHNAGIEVQINTLPEHRGRGLATVVAAHLLLYCLERGLDPHWCTSNPISAHLAENLGYTRGGPFKLLVRTG